MRRPRASLKAGRTPRPVTRTPNIKELRPARDSVSQTARAADDPPGSKNSSMISDLPIAEGRSQNVPRGVLAHGFEPL